MIFSVSRIKRIGRALMPTAEGIGLVLVEQRRLFRQKNTMPMLESER